MEYLIRACTNKDLARLVELCSNHAAFEQSEYDPTDKEDLLEKALFTDNPKLFCFVVESKEQLQGYFSYTFDYSTWGAHTFLYLDCLYLEPAFRGKKIGEVIFEKLKEIASINGCESIQWQTPTFNKRAIQFYNRMGGKSKDKVRFFFDVNQIV